MTARQAAERRSRLLRFSACSGGIWALRRCDRARATTEVMASVLGYRSGMVLGAVMCALAIAACGSTGHAGARAPSSVSADVVRFADCMRSHGVPDFADSSGSDTSWVAGGSNQSPAFRSAQKACANLEPGGMGPPTMSEDRRLAALKLAECMRTHDVPGFPDPALSVPSTLSSGDVVINLRGMVFVLAPGLNSRSPAFKRAAVACGAHRA